MQLYTHYWGFNLKNITAKVLLFYGAADKNLSLKMGQYYAAEIPHSQLIVYPNEGHLVSWTHAEEILRVFVS